VTSGGMVLLIVALVVWLVMIADLTTVVGVEASGDRAVGLALGWLYAGVLLCGVWASVACLLAIAARQGVLPATGRAAAWMMCPLLLASGLVAMYLLAHGPQRWPIAVPVAGPALVAVYAVLLYRPGAREVLGAPHAQAVFWGVAFALGLAVWPALAVRMQAGSRQEEEARQAQATWEAGDRQRRRTEALEKLTTMSPDDHITSWYPLLDPRNGVRAEAIEALKKVPRRQGDIEEGLSYGIPMMMTLVPELNLSPTPALCQAARASLAKTAGNLRASGSDRRPYEAGAMMDGTIAGVQWLADHGCDCREQAAAIASVLSSDYLDSADRRRILAAIDGLNR
jgi:hypothetical protein